MKVIVYKQDNGAVATIYPTPEAVAKYGIEAIAQKDVPFGKPYKIVNQADLPDRTNREKLWAVNEADLTDGVGADYGAGSRFKVIGWNSDGTPIVKEDEA